MSLGNGALGVTLCVTTTAKQSSSWILLCYYHVITVLLAEVPLVTLKKPHSVQFKTKAQTQLKCLRLGDKSKTLKERFQTGVQVRTQFSRCTKLRQWGGFC